MFKKGLLVSALALLVGGFAPAANVSAQDEENVLKITRQKAYKHVYQK